MVEVQRTDYIKKLKGKRHNGLVKIITGVRRSGKSYLLFKLFKRFLLNEGVNESHIISVQLDDFGYRRLHDPEALYNFLTDAIKDEEPYYILLDEIQMVKNFESVLNGLLHKPNVDLYVTGSNSKFLSSDIVTEFRGRGDEIRMYPFSFAEVYGVLGGDKWDAWSQYLRYGGMPQVLNMASAQEKEEYLKNLFSQVYLTDIINRYNLRGNGDMEAVANVLSSSVGSLTNPKRISDTFQSSGISRVSQPTISIYIGYLEDAFLISKAMRFDVKGRNYIGTPAKYYLVDVGLRNARLNFRQQDESHLMENVIYNELLRRGYSVDVGVVELNARSDNGKIKKMQLEVDFVVNSGSKRYYIQSALVMPTEEKRMQERRSLLHINDSFKKIIIQKSQMEPWYDDEGIWHLSLMDFLLDPQILGS